MFARSGDGCRVPSLLESSRASGERETSLTCQFMLTRTWPSALVAIGAIGKNGTTAQQVAKEVRGPIEQMRIPGH